MFEYCVEALHMSEAEAYLRIRAARLGREFPRVLLMLEASELHLTAIKLLAPVLTQHNADCRGHRLHVKTHRLRSRSKLRCRDRSLIRACRSQSPLQSRSFDCRLARIVERALDLLIADRMVRSGRVGLSRGQRAGLSDAIPVWPTTT